jgi:hypothetical protein
MAPSQMQNIGMTSALSPKGVRSISAVREISDAAGLLTKISKKFLTVSDSAHTPSALREITHQLRLLRH